MTYKQAIELYEYRHNGFQRLSGCSASAMNVKIRKNEVIADVTLHDYEDGVHQRYEGCRYSREELNRIRKV
jgi:type IV secretory pathway VirB9-like protein